MSRSRKKTKAQDYEYWSKRPISNRHGAIPGRTTKKITHGKERMAAKEEILKAPLEPEYDEREYVPPEADEA